MPKISVLMPVYNTPEEYLRPAIESILGQSFQDFEFIIADDGSTANVERIVRSYEDERIIFIKNEKNLGISATRNRLMDLAKGEYWAVKDSDDISQPNRLQAQADFLDARPEVGVVGSDILKIPKMKVRICPQTSVDIENGLMYECALEHPACMIRASVLLENGIRYDESLDVSVDHALFAALIGKTKFASIPQVLLHYRVHKKNVTHTQVKKMRSQNAPVRHTARAKHPGIWQRASENVKSEIRYKLFGVITLMRVVRAKRRSRYFLFGIIPIAASKQREVIFGGG